MTQLTTPNGLAQIIQTFGDISKYVRGQKDGVLAAQLRCARRHHPAEFLRRDRQYGKTEWLGREFSVVDTGGWVVNSDDIFEEEIRKQVLMAVDEADVILFVVDVMNGVTDLDEQVAAILRRAKKPVLLVANKTDNHELQYNAPEFYSLGLGDPYCISAVTGSGTGDMMDLIVSKFKKESDEILDEDIPRMRHYVWFVWIVQLNQKLTICERGKLTC
jgi:predicted GTPase